jgi:spermidine/putrescine ABC transporter ATP-binding subunit
MTSVAVELEVKGLVKRYSPQVTIGPISFAVQEGEFFSLLGPSGCGKTTSLRCIAGFEALSEGAIFLRGDRLDDKPPHRRDVGLVFQSYALFPHLTVFDNVAFGLRLRRVARPEMEERVGRMLELVGLPELAGRLPSQLSGGQQQRIAIARSLVLEPRLLLFDEPLSNLDFKLRIQMRYELRNLQRRLGKTSIYVTHDQTEALALSDRIAVLSHGRIEQVGRPREIYESPRTAFVADFIGNSNLIAATIAQSASTHAVARTEGGLRLELPPGAGNAAGERVTLLVRPERVRVRPPGEREPEGRNRVAASVEDATYLGEDVHVRVIAAEGGLALLASLKSDRFARDLRPGASVEIAIRPDDIHVLRE